jgi:hypothetical protein
MFRNVTLPDIEIASKSYSVQINKLDIRNFPEQSLRTS